MRCRDRQPKIVVVHRIVAVLALLSLSACRSVVVYKPMSVADVRARMQDVDSEGGTELIASGQPIAVRTLVEACKQPEVTLADH